MRDLRATAERYGTGPDRGRFSLLEAYMGLLLEANADFNLVSEKAASAIEEHVADSLSFLGTGLLDQGGRLGDIGSGGGLPGLVLAVARPEVQVTLIESNGKKAEFLRYAAGSLGLDNVAVETARVEELAHRVEHRERYDLVTCRAVASLSVLLEYGLPLLTRGGRLIAAKGPAAGEEIGEADTVAIELGGELEKTIRVDDSGDYERWLVVYRKTEATPGKYPRRVGIPRKRPLGGRRERHK